MTRLLSESEVETYRQRGYHFARCAEQSEVAGFRKQLEAYEAASGGRSRARCAIAATCSSPGSTR